MEVLVSPQVAPPPQNGGLVSSLPLCHLLAREFLALRLCQPLHQTHPEYSRQTHKHNKNKKNKYLMQQLKFT